jgi:hypothetical protein
MVATTATIPTTLGAVINPVQRLAWLAAQWGLLRVKTCALDLAAELISRAQIHAREPSAGCRRG